MVSEQRRRRLVKQVAKKAERAMCVATCDGFTTVVAGRDFREEATGALALLLLLDWRRRIGAPSSLASRFWRVLQKFLTSLSVLPGK
jgi:hypothetical protein